MQQHGGFVQPGPLEGSKLTLPAQTLAGNDGSYRDQAKAIALGTGLSMSGGVLRAVGAAFDGAVATWADLPVGLVTPVVESVYLVRNGSGVWLLNRKKSGLYQRVALTGDRAADWNYLGEWLEEFSDANFEVWHDDDTSRGLKFSLADQATGTTVTVRSNDLETLGTMAAGWSGVSGHLLRTDNPHAVTAAQVGLGSVDNTRDADKPVSTAQAAAIATRAPLVHGHAAEDISDSTYVGRSLLTAASAAVQRGILGLTGWATNQWTNGTTDDVPEGVQLYFTNARADARIAAQKGQAEGIMPLDSSGKAPLAYMPDALIGQVKFKGVWDAATNSPVLPSATTSMGHYYVTSVAGSYGGIDYGVGDWCISDGTAWGKVDNSDAITSFAGRVGAILPIASDYSSFYLGLHAQADDAARLGGQLPSYYAQASHVHNYAGSSTPGGAATTALECTGNSATANAAKYPQFSDDAMDPVGMDISQRISSGIYQGNPDYGVTTAKGWPMNGEWTHLVAATHTNKGNYYSMQIAGHFFSQRFFARNTNNNGTTPWVELVTSGNAGSVIPDGALSIGKTDGLQGALNVRALAYPVISFGGDSNTWTTSEFVSFCQQNGLFGAPYVSVRGTWEYASNRIISDTGCGSIHLAGALVEVFVGTVNEYLIRITTAPSGTGTTATKAVFVYQNHGADYGPGWIRIASAPAAGFTGAKVISGTTYNFVNGLLVS